MDFDSGKHDLFLRKGPYLFIWTPLCPILLNKLYGSGRRVQVAAVGMEKQHLAYVQGGTIYRKHAETEPPIPGANRPPELQKPTLPHAGPTDKLQVWAAEPYLR